MQLTQIAAVIAPEATIHCNYDIQYLLTDSRDFKTNGAQTLFFALVTSRNDGANYMGDLYRKGVRCFVVAHQSAVPTLGEDAEILRVQNPLQALQQLAIYKRSLYHGPVIGITGSNGKTVVKEWLYQLLKDDYKIVRSPKSYNSQIGVPLSVWGLQDDTELAIFEAGISQVGEMEKLEPMIRPTLGVITYIGAEHGENFDSLEQKRAEKMKLFAHCNAIIEEPSHQNVLTCAAVLRALGYPEDRITEKLMQQTHETVMTIDLRALEENVRYFRSRLKPTTQLVCMVKAFAYGTGSVEVSKRLQEAHLADYLAVAVCDEATELRRAGITLPLIIMDPETTALKKIMENNAEPNIYSFASLQNMIQAATEEGMENYPIHLKIDSGMHRLGFEWNDMEALVKVLKGQKAVRVQSVFSHLAGADESQFDDFTKSQIAAFDRCATYLKNALDTPEHTIKKHILNSAGIERFTDFQFDACRLGIGMYGVSANGARLHNVCTLITTLLSVKTVKKGESIGYGRHTFLKEDRRIAVIPIGYADGFDRRLGNYGGEVVVRGVRCPVVGNVCMDLAMVDVTDADAVVGDTATIFGEGLPLDELATKLGTITYEILTSVSRRVKRIYLH